MDSLSPEPGFHLPLDRGQALAGARLVSRDKHRLRVGGADQPPPVAEEHPHAIDVNHVNDLGWTCLLEIVILGDGGPRHVEAARLVLDAGANPNLADKEVVSPLAHARAKGQAEVAALIEKAGGKP